MEASAANVQIKTPTPSETVSALFDIHFEGQTQPHMQKLIDEWEKEGEAQGEALAAKTQAVHYLFQAVNNSFEDFSTFIEGSFEDESPTKKMLITCAKHASGSIDISDPLFRDCRRVSSEDSNILKKQIGNYFKERCNGFLMENYKDILTALNLAPANDNTLSAIKLTDYARGDNTAGQQEGRNP